MRVENQQRKNRQEQGKTSERQRNRYGVGGEKHGVIPETR